MDDHLIIFVRNPIFSQLNKNRDRNNRLSSYLDLMAHTAGITADVIASKHLYYNEYIENDSVFSDQLYQKKLHVEETPKAQLAEAIKETFGQWAKKVVFMGMDSTELSKDDILLVFQQLEHNDVVILPEKMGGILVFGMTFYESVILDHFPWETEDDLLDTIIALQKSSKTYCVLEAKNAN